MNEIWKKLEGTECYVSDAGRVKKGQKVLKPYKNQSGYLQFRPYGIFGKRKVFLHRIVAELFLERPDCIEKNQVNHKDENFQNNRADNLEWCTASYNMNYGNRVTRAKRNRKSRIEQLDKYGNVLKVWTKAMLRMSGDYSLNMIRRCCNIKDPNERNYKGYFWRYKVTRNGQLSLF